MISLGLGQGENFCVFLRKQSRKREKNVSGKVKEEIFSLKSDIFLIGGYFIV